MWPSMLELSAETGFVMKKFARIAAVLMVTFSLCGCAVQGSVSAAASPSSGTEFEPSASSAGIPSAPVPDGAKSYTIARVDATLDWGGIEQLDIDDTAWTDSFGIEAHAQLCYDDQALYVHMWADERDVRATYFKDDPLANCYEDSCLEFFVAPVADDERYLNFEFNPNCALCNEIGEQKQGRIRLFAGDDAFGASSTRTEGGWEIVYKVPFDYIRTLYPSFEPHAGMQMRGNFYKCGNLTANKHYLSWNHVDSDTPNFHVPESFGVLMFG